MNPIESFASASFTQALYWASAALFAGCLGLFTLAALADSRTIADENVWVKPSRFSVSLALHYATMAVATGWLSQGWREDWTLRVVALVSVACGIFEVAYIAVQAARRQRSHFNTSTPFYAVMYGLMAIGAVGVLVPAGAIGVAAALDTDFTAGSVMRASVALGMIGGTVLTLVTAFRLGGNGSHFIGTHPPGGRRVPFFKWSLATGDLRPPISSRRI